MKRLGRILTFAAVVANMPWIVQSYLAGDRIAIEGTWVTGLLITAGVFTGLVLTAGCCYLAHSSVVLRSWPLALGAGAVLLLEMALLSPLRVAQMGGEQLHQVLAAPWQRWGWAVLAVVAPDAVAALCSWAATAHERSGGAPESIPARRSKRLLGEAEMSVSALTLEPQDRAPRRTVARRSSVAIAGSGGEHKCGRCSREFPTVKALSGHQRWCGRKG